MASAPNLDQVQVRFSGELFQQVKKLADREGISLAEAVVRAIGVADYLDQVRRDSPGTKILIDRKGKLTELELGG